MLGYDLVSRAIQGKEAGKANGNTWDLSFPEDSAHLLPPYPKAGRTSSIVGGREAVSHPSPLGALSESLEGTLRILYLAVIQKCREIEIRQLG